MLLKPECPVLQWGHPLAAGLVAAFPFAEGAGSPRDLVAGLAGTLNSAAWATGPNGPVLRFNGTNATVTFPTIPANLHGASAGTVYLRLRNSTDSGDRGSPLVLRGHDYPADHYPYSGSIYIGHLEDTRISGAVSSVVTLTDWHSLSVVKAGTAWTFRQNQAVAASATSGSSTVSAVFFYLGGDTPHNFWWPGDIDCLYIWNRALSAQDLGAMDSDPFALVRPRQFTFFDLPSGVSATFAGTLGAVTLSGSATAGLPPTATGTASNTLGAITVTATATAALPPTATGSLSRTLGAITVSATATASLPGGATGNLSQSLGAVTLSATATAGLPPTATGSLSRTLGAITVAATATAAGPGAATGSLSATLGAITATATATAGTPPSATGNLSATLGPVTVIASGIVGAFAEFGVSTITLGFGFRPTTLTLGFPHRPTTLRLD